jgi:hypothetical protein
MSRSRGCGSACRAAATALAHDAVPAAKRASWAKPDLIGLAVVISAAILLWLPRHAGPIDLRWDGGVYFILGTSIAEGRGYKLLNEPGAIDAVQYPPLLPMVVAIHQLVLGTSDPTVVGRWLRLSSCLVFIGYAVVALRFLRQYLPLQQSVLGTLLSIFCWHAWFLSDLLFPEVWFALATLLFLIFARREGSLVHSVLAYGFALVSYGLRTVGLVALVVWVLQSLLQRRYRQALARVALALIPVACWHLYVASIERTHEYQHPAYAYQRAPYLFYNVSYARNLALRDPFTPEKGEVRIARRIARNALQVPSQLAETLTASRVYFEMWLNNLFGGGLIPEAAVGWTVVVFLSLLGGLLGAGGVVVQLLQRNFIVPLYMLLYLAALCLTPFSSQFLRYLMPVAPLLALSAILFLTTLGARAGQPPGRWYRSSALWFVVLGPALLIQVTIAISVYVREYQSVGYIDAKGEPVRYRQFFYSEAFRGFDQVIDYVRSSSDTSAIIAAGTPHWIYLRTGRLAVMPPFERDASRAQALLDTVPVRYLIIGADVVESDRYTRPVVERFPNLWEHVYLTPAGNWEVYRRIDR